MPSAPDFSNILAKMRSKNSQSAFIYQTTVHFERRALFAFIAYGLLTVSVIVLVCPYFPWLALLVPVFYSIRDWHRSLPYSANTTRVFSPDPQSPDLKSIAVALASAIDETKLNKSIDWLLCPYCSETGFEPYEIDYSEKDQKLNLRTKGFAISLPLKMRMKFESPLPLRIIDRPLRIKIQNYNGYAFLHYWQQPEYSWLLLPRFSYIALFFSLLIMYHFAVTGTFLDNPVQQLFLAFLALIFPVPSKR